MLRIGPYRFLFYSNEGNEPPHIHVKRERMEAKFWLDPVELAHNWRFPRYELNTVESTVNEHRDELLEAWHGFFDNQA